MVDTRQQKESCKELPQLFERVSPHMVNGAWQVVNSDNLVHKLWKSLAHTVEAEAYFFLYRFGEVLENETSRVNSSELDGQMVKTRVVH